MDTADSLQPHSCGIIPLAVGGDTSILSNTNGTQWPATENMKPHAAKFAYLQFSDLLTALAMVVPKPNSCRFLHYEQKSMKRCLQPQQHQSPKDFLCSENCYPHQVDGRRIVCFWTRRAILEKGWASSQAVMRQKYNPVISLTTYRNRCTTDWPGTSAHAVSDSVVFIHGNLNIAGGFLNKQQEPTTAVHNARCSITLSNKQKLVLSLTEGPTEKQSIFWVFLCVHMPFFTFLHTKIYCEQNKTRVNHPGAMSTRMQK